MTRVLTGEIKPGLVVLLDDNKLREASDCMNSAWIAPGRSMPTEGDHYFLILKEEDDEGFFLSVHLHSEPGAQRDLMDGEKTGFVDQWSQNPSYFYRREFWKLTVRAIVRSSERDNSPINGRRHYSLKDHSKIQEIIDWNARNRNEFHFVGPTAKGDGL